MSRIPPLTSLRVEDYPGDQRAWLPRLFLPLNQFFTAVTNTLNGRVDFGDNIPAQSANLSFVYDSTSQRIMWSLPTAPTQLWVGQASENGVSIGVVPIWTYDFSAKLVTANFVKINGTSISNLVVGNSYKIAIRIVP